MKQWYNRKCEIAGKKREEGWNRWRRKGSNTLWENRERQTDEAPGGD